MNNEQQPIFYYKPPVTGSLKFMHASWMKDDYKRDGWLPLYTAPPLRDLRDSEVMEECAKLCENIYSWSGAYSAGALCTHTLDAAAAAIREKAKDQSRPLYSAPPLYQIEALQAKVASLEQQAQVTLETVYETIIRWDENSGTRSRRELALRIVGLYAKAREKV